MAVTGVQNFSGFAVFDNDCVEAGSVVRIGRSMHVHPDDLAKIMVDGAHILALRLIDLGEARAFPPPVWVDHALGMAPKAREATPPSDEDSEHDG